MNWQRWERNVFLAALLVLLVAALGAGYAFDRSADLSEPLPSSLPACESDDAANAPCVWLAAEQGDRKGRSFVALPGAEGEAPTVIYLEAARDTWTPRGPVTIGGPTAQGQAR
jgi:hypothetical protein